MNEKLGGKYVGIINLTVQFWNLNEFLMIVHEHFYTVYYRAHHISPTYLGRCEHNFMR